MNTTEDEMAKMLKNVLLETREEIAYGDANTACYSDKDMINSIGEITDFQSEGILTDDEGFVIFMANGQRYQITVKEW